MPTKKLTKKLLETIIKKNTTKNCVTYSVAKRWRAFDVVIVFSGFKKGKNYENKVECTLLENESLQNFIRKIRAELKKVDSD